MAGGERIFICHTGNETGEMARFLLEASAMSPSKLIFKLVGIVALSLTACNERPDDHHGHTHAGAHESSPAHPSAEHHEAMHGDQRVVAISAGDEGFKPSRVEVEKGQATTLRFTRTSDKTCADKVVFPDIELEKELPLNKPVDVVVPTDQSRTLAFQCGMGMYKSSVVIQ